ncbi:hypothetical protein J4E85_007097 [Alternaria conjuncta]|uniref:uncharacterized protein n=1 Tax=Alternaria conjuncta TaxID=181017 RepID=UPI0022204FCE|nr:uncharacterized protein J4E85_007097 [Alternaria conjuncta]KAI4925220.1 hypothetical protein J4E85_007097 [Alternaria conjuncta]
MDSPPTTLSSQSLPTPDARPKRAAVSEEPGKKPKKPNSEIRKQQNRIASRNYREKRKRKLQYLQQLIRDDSEGRRESEPSPEQHEVYPRAPSADYDIVGASSSPYQMPSSRVFGASSAVANEAILAATPGAWQPQRESAYLVLVLAVSSGPADCSTLRFEILFPRLLPYGLSGDGK